MVVKNVIYCCLVYFICLLMNCVMLQFGICNVEYELMILCIASIIISILIYCLFFNLKRIYTKRHIIKLIIGIVLSQLSLLTAMYISFALTFNNFWFRFKVMVFLLLLADGTLKKSSYGSQTTDYTYNLANLLKIKYIFHRKIYGFVKYTKNSIWELEWEILGNKIKIKSLI